MKLTFSDYEDAAAMLACDVAAIQAVAEVESRGKAFYDDGFPVILFERHKFHKFTNGKYDNTHPHISNKTSGGYGAAGQNQRNKFNEAFRLNPEAAMKSCSWGRWQIMGFNFDDCGYDSVGEFVDAMKESEAKQLQAFVAFVISNGLAKHLRSKNWAKFAAGYNGRNYKKNAYDAKMADAYAKYAKQNDARKELAAKQVKPKDETVNESPKESPSPPKTAPDAEPPIPEITGGSAIMTAPPPYRGVGFWASIKKDLIAAFGGNVSFGTFSEYAQQASGWPEWVVGIIKIVAVGLLIATFGYFTFRAIHYFVDRFQWWMGKKIEAEALSDPAKVSVAFVSHDTEVG